MRQKTAHKAWSQFELNVKQALEAIGYTITRNQLICGSQVDLYGELQGELFIHRQIIECKSSDREVGVEEVRQLSALIDTVSTKACPISGLLVSKVGFTKTAKAFAQQAGISLLTLSELSARSFDPTPIVDQTIAWFESNDLGKSYVDLSCQVREDVGGTIYKPVERFLDEFFATTKRPGVALLGNFGTGKTSLCRHYAYLLAQRWRNGVSRHYLPVYLNLRDCKNMASLEGEIFEALSSSYVVRVTEKGVRQWLANGSTLLFLDGFDEMAAKLDRVSINENLAALAKFVEVHSVKIVLSCRTHFFKTQVEEGDLKGLLRLYMCDWGRTEVEDYIRKSRPREAEASIRVIRTTYNLEELARTPIFLNMITVTIEELGGVVNQAKLYQLYTDRWIQNQDYRSRVSPQQKRQFMEEIAYEMFSRQQPRIAYQQLPIRIKEIFGLRDYESVAAFDRDIRTCSFLVRDDEGAYYFSHKSFMEFFVGVRLARQVKEEHLDQFGGTELTYEVAGFFSSYFETDWMQLVRMLIGGSTVICRSNSALALGCMRFNEKVRDAIVLALDTELSPLVQERIVDALAEFGDDDSIFAIAKKAIEGGDLGIYCLRSLGGFQDKPHVQRVFVDILSESSDPDRVCTVLSSISRQASDIFRQPIITLASKEWRKEYLDVTASLLAAIEAIADVSFALSVTKFMMQEAMVGPHKVFAAQVRDELSKRARIDIEDMARKNKLKGLNYGDNRTSLKKSFGYLLLDDHLGELLSTLYPETTRRRTAKRPR